MFGLIYIFNLIKVSTEYCLIKQWQFIKSLPFPIFSIDHPTRLFAAKTV